MVGKNPAVLAKEKEKDLRAMEKAKEEKRKKEEADLFKPVQVAQKVPFGVGVYSFRVILQSAPDEIASRSEDGAMRVLQGWSLRQGEQMQVQP